MCELKRPSVIGPRNTNAGSKPYYTGPIYQCVCSTRIRFQLIRQKFHFTLASTSATPLERVNCSSEKRSIKSITYGCAGVGHDDDDAEVFRSESQKRMARWPKTIMGTKYYIGKIQP